MKCSLGISEFFKRSLIFPILLFSYISLHWSLRKAFLSLLAILWNSAFKWVYLSFSPLLFASLLFIAICKASSDSHFAVLNFFFLGMVLIPVSCTMSRPSVHRSSGTLSVRTTRLLHIRILLEDIISSRHWLKKSEKSVCRSVVCDSLRTDRL